MEAYLMMAPVCVSYENIVTVSDSRRRRHTRPVALSFQGCFETPLQQSTAMDQDYRRDRRRSGKVQQGMQSPIAYLRACILRKLRVSRTLVSMCATTGILYTENGHRTP